jgi:DNA-binding SARP family transcriptional activator
MGYRIGILGPPRIVAREGSPEASLSLGKPFGPLSYLVVEDRPVSREELSTLLWPNSPPSRARHSVRQAVWLIRKSLGEEVKEFILNFEKTLERIDENPEVDVRMGDKGPEAPIPPFPVQHSPSANGEDVRVLALMHHCRRPGYWKGRT